jgi:hypothetical protein
MNNIQTICVDIGAFTGATIHPLVYLPSTCGDVTLLDVQITGIAAGTSIGLILTTATDVGTPAVSGTLAAFAGTVVYAEGVVFEATISDASIDTGTGSGIWLAVDQTSGTCPASTWMTINYVFGL